MTLLKKEADNQPEFDPAEEIKMEKFTQWIKELAVYLGDFRIACNNGDRLLITNIEEYNNRLLNGTIHHKRCCYDKIPFNFICITGNKGKSLNLYSKKIIETIFPVNTILLDSYKNPYFGSNNVKYGSDICNFGWTNTAINELLPTITPACTKRHINVWRDDIHFFSNYSKKIFDYLLQCIDVYDCNGYYHTWWVKYYNIFWNLFIIAIDDDAYNEQLNNVVELANYWDFDEPMMRDWCRAVEYVLAGNKLSEDCDFECETVEGARFFLHKK